MSRGTFFFTQHILKSSTADSLNNTALKQWSNTVGMYKLSDKTLWSITTEQPPVSSLYMVFWCWKIRRSRKSIFLDKLFTWLHWGKRKILYFHHFVLKTQAQTQKMKGKRDSCYKISGFYCYVYAKLLQQRVREKMMMPQILCENFWTKFLFPVPTYFCSFHWLHLTRHDTSS